MTDPKHPLRAASVGSADRLLTIVTAPEALPGDGRPVVFVGGSIEMGTAVDWQSGLIRAIGDLEAVALNPRRADWDADREPVASDPIFREQVDWELAALERADVIALHLAAGTRSPISLLEFGLHARSGKLVVCCEPGFWREGNVKLTAARYGVEVVADLETLVAAIRGRLLGRPESMD